MATPASPLLPTKRDALPRLTAALFFLQIGASLAIPATVIWLRFRFVPVEKETGPPFFIHWLIVLHTVLGRLWGIRLALALAAGVAFIAWLYTRYRELAENGLATRYRPHWAITGFLIPGLNFVRPYQVVSDAIRVAANRGRSPEAAAAATPLVAKLWWAFVLATTVVGVLGGKSVKPGYTEVDGILIAWYLGGAVTSALAVAVIAALERERERGDAGRGAFRLTPLTSTTGAALGTALALLAVFGMAAGEMRQLKAQGGGIELLPPEMIPRGALPPRAPRLAENRQGTESPRSLAASATAPGSVPAQVSGVPVPERIEMPAGVAGGVAGGNPIGPVGTGVEGGVPGGMPGGVPGGVVGGVISQPAAAVGSRQEAGSKRVVLSQSIMDRSLIRRVDPVYPESARKARAAGTVRLHVVVEKDGRIQSVRPLGGHPLLTQAAMDAVRQWRYRPYTVNGELVEVEFPVTLRFSVAD